jgi:hypothetical protein
MRTLLSDRELQVLCQFLLCFYHVDYARGVHVAMILDEAAAALRRLGHAEVNSMALLTCRHRASLARAID